MIRRAVVLSLAITQSAHADNRGLATNVLAGPVIGVAWGRGHQTGALIGVEAGAGYGPERINVGFETGADRSLGYVELDPWYVLGVSLGIGLDSDLAMQPVIGAWEGAPIAGLCEGNGFHFVATLSVGFRYAGIYEVYVTPKFGEAQNFCSTND
jgi:hypothetical protein